MTTLREAAQQALDALDWHSRHGANWSGIDEATEALRAALATGDNLSPTEPVQEPVVWGVDWGQHGDRSCVSIIKKRSDGVMEVVAVEYGPDGSAPPQRKPLTEEEIKCVTSAERDSLLDHIYEYGTAAEGVLERINKLARAIERAHGITP